MWFAWSDEKMIWEAIETIDPLKVTAHWRPVVIVGFEGDGYHQMSDLAKIVQNGHDTCIIVDGRRDLDGTISKITDDCGDEAWHSVIGIARLDLADQSTYQGLVTALEGRWEWYDLESPYIEF
jgi:hypothetical protein